eukprot:2740223-Pyramimonas_sp.AAC.1
MYREDSASRMSMDARRSRDHSAKSGAASEVMSAREDSALELSSPHSFKNKRNPLSGEPSEADVERLRNP